MDLPNTTRSTFDRKEISISIVYQACSVVLDVIRTDFEGWKLTRKEARKVKDAIASLIIDGK